MCSRVYVIFIRIIFFQHCHSFRCILRLIAETAHVGIVPALHGVCSTFVVHLQSCPTGGESQHVGGLSRFGHQSQISTRFKHVVKAMPPAEAVNNYG
jgi:hypothetical protein